MSFLRGDVNATFYMDGATLAIGNFPQGVPYIPLNPAEDWNRCQRFYEIGYSGISTPSSSVGNWLQAPSGFNTRTSATPTVNYVTTGSGNTSYVGVVYVQPGGFDAQLQAAGGAGAYWSFNWTAEVT
jgi:hypothetical protein